MSQFQKYYDFIFDGFNSRGRFMICSRGSGDNLSQFGASRSINEEEGIGDIPVFYGVKSECPTLEISISKVNNGEISPFADDDLKELSRILFKKDYRALIINGLIYYCIFTKGEMWSAGRGEGVITLSLRLNAPYAYSSIMNNPVRVINTKTIEVYNKSTVCEDIYPDIEFLLGGDSTSIKITNMTTGQIVEFNGLEKLEHVYVYNDGLKQVISKSESTRNIFKLFNKEWLRLVYGKNIIKIECENCKFDLIYQNKIHLY